MFLSIFGSIESGIIYAIMALGVYISFRILDFPDLTVDGSFVTGAAIAAIMIVSGYNPVFATAIAMLSGMLAGFLTGIIHTKGKISALLSGILMMIALYSINLRIMGRPNLGLFSDDITIFTYLTDIGHRFAIDDYLNKFLMLCNVTNNLPKSWSILLFMLIFTFSIKLMLDYFFKTEIGLAIRATGDNKRMIRSFSANTDRLTILGLGISNGLVALSGALIAQYSSFADIGLGVGMIIIGLASVIIGESLFGTKTIARATLAVIGGAIIYRSIITLALYVDFVNTGDMKLITASIVTFALVIPRFIVSQKAKHKRLNRRYKKIATLKLDQTKMEKI